MSISFQKEANEAEEEENDETKQQAKSAISFNLNNSLPFKVALQWSICEMLIY